MVSRDVLASRVSCQTISASGLTVPYLIRGLDVSSDLQAGLAAARAGDVYWRAVCTWCPIHSNHSEYMDCSVFSSTSRRPPNHVPAVPGIRAQRTMARWSLRTQFLKSDGGQAGMRTSFINLRLVIHYH